MTPEEVMGEVRRIEIVTRHLVRSIVAGEYSSAFRGRGVEFSEVREYQPGDDVRSIDWNVTARLGAAYVKRYLEERELTLLFLVDASASEDFGTRIRTKRALAVEVCAVLALAAARNNDRVGVAWATDRARLRPRGNGDKPGRGARVRGLDPAATVGGVPGFRFPHRRVPARPGEVSPAA